MYVNSCFAVVFFIKELIRGLKRISNKYDMTNQSPLPGIILIKRPLDNWDNPNPITTKIAIILKKQPEKLG